jgi:DNA-binding transcriptional LysR family regulator
VRSGEPPPGERPKLRDESWVVCPNTTLGQLTMSLCTTAGFEPRVIATVNDIGTAIDLVGFGWGITVATAESSIVRTLRTRTEPA